MIDPEVAREERAKARASSPEPSPESDVERTIALLEQQRTCDDRARAHWWLSRVRGDLLPRHGDLSKAIAAAAAEDTVDVAIVRAALDRVLAESGGLAAWEFAMRRPRKLVGRSLDAKEPQPLTPSDVRQQLRQLRLLPRANGS